MGRDSNDKKTIQTNIKTNGKNYNNFGYFLGGIDVTNQNLDSFDPYIKGISRIYLFRPPFFLERGFPELTANFKSIIETGYTKIDGINDISVDFVEFEGGFNGQKFSNVSMARDDTDTLTITVYEQSGSPVREYIECWVSGTRDLRNGVAHYMGLLSPQIPYGEKYHNAEFIYYTLDPTAREVEYACMFAKAFPTKIPKSHYNYEKGDRGNVEYDLEFKVMKYESYHINEIANWYQAKDTIHWNSLDFNPNITEKEVDAAFSLNLQ